MRPLILALIAVLAVTGAATPAAAQTPADRADARCLLVLQVLSRDPRNAEAASKGIFYYLGRLQAHGLTAKLGPLFVEEAKAMATPQQAEIEAKRCNGELNAHSIELRNVFQRLQQQAPPRSAAAPPPKK